MNLTITSPQYLQVGDRVTWSRAPNSVRTFVKTIITDTKYEVFTIKRPSRGWARHIRRTKNK